MANTTKIPGPAIEFKGETCFLCRYRDEKEWDIAGVPTIFYVCRAFAERLQTNSPLAQPMLNLIRCTACKTWEETREYNDL